MTDPTNPRQALERLDPMPIQIASPAPSVAEILQAIVTKGVSEQNVAAVEKIVALYERLEDKKAERDFAVAFNALQAEMPKVQAMSIVPGNDGTERYRFAAYEDIMSQVAPMLQKHGFTVTFSTEFDGDRIFKCCTLQHISGHKRSNRFGARIGAGPPKASVSQADGAASTYAKRFALCDMLNITIEKDTDARVIGDTLTPEQAEELKRRVMETESNETAFLKFCGVGTSATPATLEDYRRIPSERYDAADEMLRRKERKGR